MRKIDQLKQRLENYSIKAVEFKGHLETEHQYVRLDMAKAALDEVGESNGLKRFRRQLRGRS